ncbi:hypothetical protein D3C78_1492240 [compost metagenome]
MKFVVDGVQLFVKRNQFFLGGFQFFVGGLQLFVHGQQLFVGRAQFLQRGLVFLSHGLQAFTRLQQFDFHMAGRAVLRCLCGGMGAPLAIHAALKEQDQISRFSVPLPAQGLDLKRYPLQASFVVFKGHAFPSHALSGFCRLV